MGYNTPPTKNPGDLLGALDWNTYIRDNDAYFLVRPLSFAHVWVAGTYTTTSTTLVDIDGTGLATTHSNITGRVFINFQATMYADATRLCTLVVDVDGVDYYFGAQELTTNQRIVTGAFFTGLNTGSHTYKVQWMTNGGTITITKDFAVRLSIMEV